MTNRPDLAGWRRLEPLLDAALELEDGPREAYLESICSGDPALRYELERLLEACRAAESFLVRPAADLWPGLAPEPAPGLAPGARIGPYRTVREAGRGGMATVYVAERADGEYRKRVALKLVSGGLGLDEHLARRFRDERQILASLDHPHIARLLDGGVTPDGTPWFALEYVEGLPIDRFAEERGLSVDQRLRLFLQVCDAVQYAHSNLVVHRDLKPSNIYITPDGQSKLLDFGIAKLLGEGVGPESALQTSVGWRCMTPEYAAPEQIRGEPVTTATDVYQLGVVLYELLTGGRPFERDGGTLHDLEQAVLTREPAKPSSRAGRAPRRPSPVATEDPPAVRRIPTAPHDRLHRILRGDLDAIVLKSLRKESLKRYASAQELAGDIEDYLLGLPVAARRGTTAYRATKFMRRHRWGVGMAAALVLLLTGYAITVTVQTARVRVEAAKAQHVSDFLMGLFEASDADQSTGKEVTARELLERGVARADELSDQPEVQAEMLNLVGSVYQNWGLYDRAQPLIERGLAVRRQVFGEEHEDVAESLNDLGTLLDDRGDYEAAEALLERALAMRRKLLGEEHREVARSMVDLARVVEARGQYDRAEQLQRNALDMRRRLLGGEHEEVATSLNDLGLLLWRRGHVEAAEPLFREVLAIDRKVLGEEHWYIGNVMTNLGHVLMDKGDYPAAESLFLQALAMQRKLLGEEHPAVAATLIALGRVANNKGDYEQADSLFRAGLERRRAAFGDAHPSVTGALVGLAETHLDRQQAAEAEPLLREALEILRRTTPDDRRRTAEIHTLLGRCLTSLGRYAEAEALLVPSYPVLGSAYGPADRRTREALQYLVELFTIQGKTAQATAYQGLVLR